MGGKKKGPVLSPGCPGERYRTVETDPGCDTIQHGIDQPKAQATQASLGLEARTKKLAI